MRHYWKLALALGASAPLLAQIVVDPNGGGQYTDLQAAIDASPPGSVIRVVGGSYGPLQIAKTITIIGDPDPTISAPSCGQGPYQPPAITLGSASAIVTLVRVKVTGTTGICYGYAGPAIQGGAAELRVLHSTVHAPLWFPATGWAAGVPAITGPTRVVLVGSDVRGSHSENCCGPVGWGPDGPAAVLAGAVLALESTIVGGNGSDAYWSPFPPPTWGTGAGGDAIVANVIFESACIVRAGTGGAVYYDPTSGGPPLWLYGGKLRDGVPYRSPQVNAMPPDLAAPTAPGLGKTWSVYSWVQAATGAVCIGPLASAPTPLGAQWLFVDLANAYFVGGVAGGYVRLQVPVPNVSALAGTAVTVQVYDPAVGLTRPVFEVVQF